MAIIQTTKHEMSYDRTTKRAIFNGRNKTANLPQNDAWPERLVSSLHSLDFDVVGSSGVIGILFDKGYLVNELIIKDKSTGEVVWSAKLASITDNGLTYSGDDINAYEQMSVDNLESDESSFYTELEAQPADVEVSASFIKLEGSFYYEL